MPARLDLALIHKLARSFPGGQDWNTIHARTFIADRGEQVYSNWSAARELRQVGGVYAVLLPVAWFEKTTTMPLHPPHTHCEDYISFEFTLAAVQEVYGVIYVGKTIDLSRRFRLHLVNGARKNGGQVKFGLLDCALHTDPINALRALREHARFVYTKLSGPEQCANRDVLEMALCARFGPPFNIKSER